MSEINISILILRGTSLLLGLRALDILNQVLMSFRLPQEEMGNYLLRFSLWFVILSTMALLVWIQAPNLGRRMVRGMRSADVPQSVSDQQNLDLKYTLYACTGFFILSGAIGPFVKLVTTGFKPGGGLAIDWLVQVILLVVLGCGLVFARCIDKKCKKTDGV